MANDITSNPWTLDTPDGVLLGADPVTGLGGMTRVKVEHFEFIDYVADGDTCRLVDRNGKVVWEGNGADDLKPVESHRIGWVNGLALTVLDNAAAGSKVRVYMAG